MIPIKRGVTNVKFSFSLWTILNFLHSLAVYFFHPEH